MSLSEELSLFKELICCSHNLYFWQLKPDLELIYTSCPEDLKTGYKFFLNAQAQPILNYAADGKYPFIMDSYLNILWIADFARNEGALEYIYLIGPVFAGEYSYNHLINILTQRNLSAKTRAEIMKQIEQVPVISTNILFQYAIMLHYCICKEKISYKHFSFSSAKQEFTDPDHNKRNVFQQHTGIWASEQSLLNMVKNGSPNIMDALSVSSSLSSGIRFHSDNNIRNAKNNCLALLILVSRAAIDGGLKPDTAYTLCDYYAQRIEDTNNVSETSLICKTLLEDYTQRVRDLKEHDELSRAVYNCCDYISAHITDDLSIEFLASRAGYTEYYFSRKFKKEIGISISEYIKREKIKKAQILLSSTNMDIVEISTELGFSSRNYFSDTFQKITGCSPAKYRKEHSKI